MACRECEFGKELAELATAAGENPDGASRPLDERANPVVLELEDPAFGRERRAGGRGEHGDEVSRSGGPELRPGLERPASELFLARDAGGHFLDGESGKNRPPLRLDRLRDRPAGGVFGQEEPVLSLLAPRANEDPTASKLVSLELEIEFASCQSFRRTLAVRRPKTPAIPHDDGSGSVVSRRDHPLEVGVLERMVFGTDGEPLLAGIDRGPARNGPAREHSLDFEPKVPVHPPRGVLLDDEEASRGVSAPGRMPEGLGRPSRVSLPGVCTETGPGFPARLASSGHGCYPRR
ncbi:MAG: hypothetical protein KatS3mg076_0938 [Candidatus Binatia bacterium]|nr:MAG: hypothetical protein KatS3mg076_0938 [Candidatus Binatia bacterium]